MSKKQDKKKVIIVLCIIGILFINGIFIGAFLSQKLYNELDYKMWEYACDDGCSRATMDSRGFLTNETFDCWDKCRNYIEEIKGDEK